MQDLLFLAITGCHGGPEKAHEEPLPTASVRVQSVESREYPVTENIVGPRDFKVAACVAVRGAGEPSLGLLLQISMII